MRYGVDQCRRCGKPMRERRDSTRAEDRRPGTLTEPQWRAQGWLAKPTRMQERFPAYGCCMDCIDIIIRKNWKPGLRVALSSCAILAFAALLWWLMELFHP
jgi:hypothetical protein